MTYCTDSGSQNHGELLIQVMGQPVDVLSKYWGYPSFRPNQEEIINSVLEGNDTLALLPTGAGKSICFQVPAMCLPGLCIVITPLIALMKDQVEQLKRRNISASAIYSGLSRREIDIILDNCVFNKVKFLYVSPERLKSDLFQKRISEAEVSLLAIDEAHCISQWGYDFRPSYLEIPESYEILGQTRRIALTATATEDVERDILGKLSFNDPKTYRNSFARKNLSYSAFQLENKDQKIVEILKNVMGSGIVYVRTRKETLRVAQMLNRNGIIAQNYHGGMLIKERAQRQEAWVATKVRVMVATNAFGMGIDKPDVRSVIHAELPDSLEAYYQEAGRAGRDRKNAYAVLIFNNADLERQKENFERSFPSLDFLKRVYQALSNYYKMAVGSSQWQSFDFQIDSFVKTYKLNAYDTFHAIKKLEEQGLLLLNESFFKQSTVIFSMNHEEIYKYSVANAKQEPLIKALLRLYGGELYADFMKINEGDLAKLCKSTALDISKNLEFLHKSNVLVYDKTKEKPQLTFLTPRLEVGRLNIDGKKIEQRRKNSRDKLKYMQRYALESNQCRTRIFQEYFGEAVYLNCGNCDRCITEKKKHQQRDLVDNIQSQILKSLTSDWKHFNEVKHSCGEKNDFIVTEAIRALMDEGKLEINSQNELRLVR